MRSGGGAFGVDHDAERTIEGEDAVRRDVFEIEDYAHDVVGMPPDTDLADDVAGVTQHLVLQIGHGLDVFEIEEHSRRAR